MASTDKPMSGRWRQGWWSPAQRLASPNFGQRPAGLAVELVVLELPIPVVVVVEAELMPSPHTKELVAPAVLVSSSFVIPHSLLLSHTTGNSQPISSRSDSGI